MQENVYICKFKDTTISYLEVHVVILPKPTKPKCLTRKKVTQQSPEISKVGSPGLGQPALKAKARIDDYSHSSPDPRRVVIRYISILILPPSPAFPW